MFQRLALALLLLFGGAVALGLGFGVWWWTRGRPQAVVPPPVVAPQPPHDSDHQDPIAEFGILRKQTIAAALVGCPEGEYGPNEFHREVLLLLQSRRGTNLDRIRHDPAAPEHPDDAWFARQPLLRAFLQLPPDARDAAPDFFLRTMAADGGIDPQPNAFTAIYTRTFGRLQTPNRVEGLFARRRLHERLSELRTVAGGAAALSGLAIDEPTHAILAWAVRTLAPKAGALRDADRDYVVGATELISVHDCRYVVVVQGVWPPRRLGGSADHSPNVVGPVDAESAEALLALRAAITAERAHPVSGLTDDQQGDVRKVYDGLERFIDGELNRERRVHRTDWKPRH